MQALIVDDDQDRQADLAIAFMNAGFHTTSTGSQTVAECCLRNELVDLLVLSERVGGRLTHSLSLLAEHRNPLVETLMLTSRNDPDIEELFLLLPSLHSLIAPDTAPELITKLATAAIYETHVQGGPLVLTPDQMVLGSDEELPPALFAHTEISQHERMVKFA